MNDIPRLIEVAFPLQQASIDSVHEKDIRSGHISSIHVWPARRPLAACRAALIATLLRAPADSAERRQLLERIGGRVVERIERKKVNGKVLEVKRAETEGGILHWGRESSRDIEWFREEIRKANGGRVPRVLDPFSGGGAIPLEAMRLGCEAHAIDINPVAWFVLKCTLEYPQRLAGQTLPLPTFARESEEFMAALRKGARKSAKGGRPKATQTAMFDAVDAGLPWHVRAWGSRVLQRTRAKLEPFYSAGNGERTVAYLWARTVTCKNCRAVIPLLKTRWLSKAGSARVLLTTAPNAERSGVTFGITTSAKDAGGNAAQRRERDKRLGAGTMSRSGATCPCCGVITTMDDLRAEGQADRLGVVLTAVVVEDKKGKRFRLPIDSDSAALAAVAPQLERASKEIPFGLPTEAISAHALGFRVPLYGIDRWSKLFTDRQMLALATLVHEVRESRAEMTRLGVPAEWSEAIHAYLACAIDRLVDFLNVNAQWKVDRATVNHALVRFAVQMTWDFAEANALSSSAGSFALCLERVVVGLESVLPAARGASAPKVTRQSAIQALPEVDLVVTDPPYYDAIPYSDLMDWFYVWLRRTVFDASPEYATAMTEALAPKWDSARGDGELIEDASRHAGSMAAAREAYESGMAHAFERARAALVDDGRMVVVFANKQPEAWEALASAVIRSGFVVDASWPIETEQRSRTRGQASAALSSSVWLVCRKRPDSARPGWDSKVLDEMRERINVRLREFWDAGIRGPDFVWAATGPAMEAYSKHPIVKKANEPGQVLSVAEFLGHVRRLVVDFVVGRVLTKNADAVAVSGLDDVTTYYLLHRNDFGFTDAPAGACILYAVSCGLSDRALTDQHDLLIKTGGSADADDSDEEPEEDGEENEAGAPEGSGSKLRLKAWQDRKRKSMGIDSEGRPAPLIDQAHRLMQLWRAGDVVKVDEYIDSHALRRNTLFHQLLQALIELSVTRGDERALLESVSNHVFARGALAKDQRVLPNLEVTT